RHGASVRTGAAAKIVVDEDRVRAVEAGGERWDADAVVCAVPWFALSETIEGHTPALAGIVERARRMESSPIVTVNLWFDRPVIDEPFLGLPGRSMQWVFDKRLLLGEETSHLSLVSSGASPLVHLANHELVTRARE